MKPTKHNKKTQTWNTIQKMHSSVWGQEDFPLRGSQAECKAPQVGELEGILSAPQWAAKGPALLLQQAGILSRSAVHLIRWFTHPFSKYLVTSSYVSGTGETLGNGAHMVSTLAGNFLQVSQKVVCLSFNLG